MFAALTLRPGAIITGDAAVVIAGRGVGKRIPPAINTARPVMPTTTPRPIQAERAIVLKIPHSHDARKRLAAARPGPPVCIRGRVHPEEAAASSHPPRTSLGQRQPRPTRPTATADTN